jgi:hypothetical protein
MSLELSDKWEQITQFFFGGGGGTWKKSKVQLSLFCRWRYLTDMLLVLKLHFIVAHYMASYLLENVNI